MKEISKIFPNLKVLETLSLRLRRNDIGCDPQEMKVL